jgi:hypothetical protein
MMDDDRSVSPLLEQTDFEVGGRTYGNTMRQDLNINSGDLSGDFIDHPEKFAKWATLDYTVRTQGSAAGVKLTEKMVENTVITSPEYVSAQDLYRDSTRTCGLLKVARDAMIHRRDMLIQLGATYRAEGNSDISIREDGVRGLLNKKNR